MERQRDEPAALNHALAASPGLRGVGGPIPPGGLRVRVMRSARANRRRRPARTSVLDFGPIRRIIGFLTRRPRERAICIPEGDNG